MITKQELLGHCYGGKPGWDENCEEILAAVNIIRAVYGRPMIVSCFYRSPAHDKAKGRSGKSQHCLKRAVDFSDPSGSLDTWCKANLDILEKAGLWLESPDHTPGWCHLDLKPRKNRVFLP